MTPVEVRRFRSIYDELNLRFVSGRLCLLEIGEGYVFFTSDKLHKRYGNKGSGQWAEIPDRFFFALNYTPVVKNGQKKGDLDIELFDYGYKEERDALLSSLAGSELLRALDERKGYTCLYAHPLLPAKPKKSEAEALSLVVENLRAFLDEVLPRLEEQLG